MAVNPEIDLVSGFREMTEDDVPEIIEIERKVYTKPWSEGIFKDCIRVGYNCWVFWIRIKYWLMALYLLR